jgi:hypothetical protein
MNQRSHFDSQLFKIEIEKIISQGLSKPSEYLEKICLNINAEQPLPRAHAFLMDPITWSFVLEEIGKGIVAWAAGKALDKVFGSKSDDRAFRRAVSQAVTEVTRNFEGILREQQLLEALRQVETLELNLREYYRARDSRRSLLDSITTDCNDLVLFFNQSGLDWIGGYMLIQSIHFLIIQERYYVTSDKGELDNLSGLKSEIYAKFVDAYTETRDRNRSYFGPIKWAGIGNFVYYSFKGTNYGNELNSMKEIEDWYNKAILDNFDKEFGSILDPLSAMAGKLLELPTEPTKIPLRQ